MALLNPSYETQSLKQTYCDELANAQLLLDETNKAIQAINGGAQSYEFDTGQNNQKVKKADLGKLLNQRNVLLGQIEQLHHLCKGGGGLTVRPEW